jgi:hypothetical protein
VLIDAEAYHQWLEEQNPERELIAKGRGVRS